MERINLNSRRIKGVMVLLLLLIVIVADGQKTSYFDLSVDYTELKDQMNYGLVFRGPNLQVGYSLDLETTHRRFRFESEFGFGPSFARGMAGINFRFQPAQLDYLFPIEIRNSTLWIGPYAAIRYNYHLYPELHSGHTYWFTAIDFGPSLIFETEILEKDIAVNLETSLYSITSRPAFEKEDYFYFLRLTDIIKNANSDFSFSLQDKRYYVALSFVLKDINQKGWSVVYCLSQSIYEASPRTNYFTNSISFRKQLGMKNKKHENL